MLAKQYRLQKDKDFELAFKKGRTFSNEFLFLRLRRNDLNISRFGFIVGKKISKKATVRNRIRRRLGEIIRGKLADVKPGFDVAIGTKGEIVEKNYQDLDKEVGQLLKRAGLL